MQDLRLINETGESITVTTTVTRDSDEEKILSDSITLAHEEVHRYINPIEEDGTYQIQVSVEAGDENIYEWDAPADEAYGIYISGTAVDVPVRSSNDHRAEFHSRRDAGC